MQACPHAVSLRAAAAVKRIVEAHAVRIDELAHSEGVHAEVGQTDLAGAIYRICSLAVWVEALRTYQLEVGLTARADSSECHAVGREGSALAVPQEEALLAGSAGTPRAVKAKVVGDRLAGTVDQVVASCAESAGLPSKVHHLAVGPTTACIRALRLVALEVVRSRAVGRDCGEIDDARKGEAAAEVDTVSLLAVPACEVAGLLIDQVAVAVGSDPGSGHAGSAQQHAGRTALGAQSGIPVHEGAAAALVVALAVPQDVPRLAGSAGALRTNSDAVDVLDGTSPCGVEHCAGQTLQTGPTEEEAACECTLTGVPDRLEGGPAGEAVERGIVPRAVGQSALWFASATFHRAESLTAGQAAGVVGGRLAAGGAVLLAVSGCLQQNQQQKDQGHGTAQKI